MKINEFIKYEECAWNWIVTGIVTVGTPPAGLIVSSSINFNVIEISILMTPISLLGILNHNLEALKISLSQKV